ncbi:MULTISPECIES: DUF1254 domain-containing protein [Pseudomonas]|jgi:hypothetical protein|uniref:DUF1254 domain-containing protein n=1 Tax=Pseudomonas TaxID=286 RepID=UPI000D8BA9E4|nr:MULTISPECIES: DUF1254 domain-containing protein [Pseudomonas]MBD0680250.1 hypothetical protein [Pseudomonas sp. PSB11]MCK8687518.1 DUF1254 domain-containing protein [Pseudomonas umsongensis]MDI3393436.1 DUF1254 domain-containing protein [Pseudomonas sp. V98_8]MDP9690296.1 hypothetical protein [Pseudomonas mohnii]
MSITQALTSIALIVASSAVFPLVSQAQSKITAEEAHAIGVDAYVYFYPLLTMDITRKQFTNIEPGKEFGKGPMNMFVSVPEYPPADFKGVVRSNFDTLYSIAWLDLTKEPLVIAAPDTAGRFYLLPMLDMWSDVFASPGWRTTGTDAAQFLVTPPGWTGTVPAGLNHLPAPTPFVWVIGRTKTDGAADYAAVHKIQAGYTVTPLSRLGKGAEPVSVKIDPAVDMKTPPKIQVDTMSAADYFAYAAELLKVHPAHGTDQPLLAQIKRIGIEPGKSFSMDALDPEIKAALETAPKDAQALMAWKVPTLARVVNGWSMNTDTMGVYGNYYLKRAIVAQVGLGANLPEDAIYPLNIGDVNGNALDGAHKYVLHFAKDEVPPVNAFWSITLYDPEGFQVGNELNRFAVSSWMPFKNNADGSLDIYFQNENPGKDLEANWLPAPKGPFNLTMRLYGPKSEALNGKWNPPAVKQM